MTPADRVDACRSARTHRERLGIRRNRRLIPPPSQTAAAPGFLTLPATEKDTLLTTLASGQGTQAQALLLRRFRDTTATADHSASTRRAAELLEAADARMLERKRAEEEELNNPPSVIPVRFPAGEELAAAMRALPVMRLARALAGWVGDEPIPSQMAGRLPKPSWMRPARSASSRKTAR
jgi:hypothetical protein